MIAPCPYRNLPGTADGCALCGALRQQHASYSSANEEPVTTAAEELEEADRAAHEVCQALLGLRTPAALSAALGTDLPEGVADVLLALTAWMDATGQVDMSKRTITFEARGEKYSLMAGGDLDRMRGEIFSVVADNLDSLATQCGEPSDPATKGYQAGIADSAAGVRQLGAYYIAKYTDALAEAGALDPAPEPVEPLPPTDPSPSMG